MDRPFWVGKLSCHSDIAFDADGGDDDGDQESVSSEVKPADEVFDVEVEVPIFPENVLEKEAVEEPIKKKLWKIEFSGFLFKTIPGLEYKVPVEQLKCETPRRFYFDEDFLRVYKNHEWVPLKGGPKVKLHFSEEGVQMSDVDFISIFN